MKDLVDMILGGIAILVMTVFMIALQVMPIALAITIALWIIK